jgi:NAD(P)H-nitrite reductase large subunit
MTELLILQDLMKLSHASHTAGTMIGAGNVQDKHRGFLNKATIVNADAFDIISNAELFYRDYNIRVTNNSYATIERDDRLLEDGRI